MRRNCSALLAAAFLLLTIVPPAAAGPREPDWPAAVAEYRQVLADLIAIDSTSPPGHELAVAEYLRSLFTREGIVCQVFAADSGRANLVARLRGSGKKRPLLLLGHTDVVGIERDHWHTDPFALTERGGHYYGRGVIDDKGMVAAEVLTLVWLERLDVRLDRDVILLAECDEESGGKLGVAWMLEHHREAIDAEYALNEGGRIILAGDQVSWVGIQTAEKQPVNVKLVARGTSGHASMPRRDNAIAALGRAVSRFAEPVFPVELTPETRTFFSAIAPLQEPEVAYAMRHLDHADSADVFARTVGRDILFDAMLRNTVSPTIIDGGFRSNVIPAEAEATLNCRLLPGSDHQWLEGELRRLIDDPAILVAATPPARPPSPSMPFSGPVVEAVERACRKMAPGAPVVPLLSAGATDSAQLRLAGINAYGLLPFPITTEDAGRMHGNNERMPVASLEFGLKMMFRVTAAIAQR